MSTGEILSFHPLVPGDVFIWERGILDESLAQRIGAARAVILPQSVDEPLYRFCAARCPHVFPDYRARFAWQGKVGATLLFWSLGFPHPCTRVFPRVETLVGEHPQMGHTRPELKLPVVIKANHGGGGNATWLVEDQATLATVIGHLKQLEQRGNFGFVVQEYLEGLGRDLRVVVIGEHLESYWRSSPGFLHNLNREGVIDRESDPELQEAGKKLVHDFCRATGINLAGFDLVFPGGTPMLLEINYVFGRSGLGGGDRFHAILEDEVNRWLSRLP